MNMRLAINLQQDLASFIPDQRLFFNTFHSRLVKLESPYMHKDRLNPVVMTRFEKHASRILRNLVRRVFPESMVREIEFSYAWHVDYEITITVDVKTSRLYNERAAQTTTQLN